MTDTLKKSEIAMELRNEVLRSVVRNEVLSEFHEQEMNKLGHETPQRKQRMTQLHQVKKTLEEDREVLKIMDKKIELYKAREKR